MHPHLRIMQGRMNDASRARSIHRRLKGGTDPSSLKNEVKMIRDPYHRSIGYLELSLSEHSTENDMKNWLVQSFSDAGKVKQEWRRAELLADLLKKANKSGQREEASRLCIETIEKMRSGNGLSQAVRGIAANLHEKYWEDLIDSAWRNSGFRDGDLRAVIKSILSGSNWRNGYDLLVARLGSVDDPIERAGLLWYVHARAQKSQGGEATHKARRSSLDAFDSINNEEERMKTFSYICRNCSFEEDLEQLNQASEVFKKPQYRIKALGSLSTAADRSGDSETARLHLRSAEELMEELNSDAERASALLMIASAHARLGEDSKSRILFEKALECADKELMLKKTIETRMKKHGYLKREERERFEKTNKKRHFLALCDTYEGGLKPVHSRAVARAAPLCAAFDLDLALIGFPSDDLDRIIDLAVTDTNIGKGGTFLRQLHQEGRIILLDPELVGDMGLLSAGIPVATTSSPDRSKAVSLEEAIALSRNGPGNICLIMGLGRKGLPGKLLKAVAHHLEITGSNVPLETATAMGILAYMIHREVSRD
jgi:hypothetical protein